LPTANSVSTGSMDPSLSNSKDFPAKHLVRTRNRIPQRRYVRSSKKVRSSSEVAAEIMLGVEDDPTAQKGGASLL